MVQKMIGDRTDRAVKGQIAPKNMPVFEAAEGDSQPFHARKLFKIWHPIYGLEEFCEIKQAIYGGIDPKTVQYFGIWISENDPIPAGSTFQASIKV